MENIQVIENLKSLDRIEKEISGNDCIQQELKKLQNTESLLFSEVIVSTLTTQNKNDKDLTPKINNPIAEIKRDLNNTSANLERFEKCVFDVLSTKQI